MAEKSSELDKYERIERSFNASGANQDTYLEAASDDYPTSKDEFARN